MGRPEGILDVGVILRTLVGVVDQQADGGSRGAPVEYAGQDAHLVGLAPLGGKPRGARFAPVQIALQVTGGQLQAGRAAVDDASQGGAVTLAKAGDCEQFADCIARHDTPVPVCKSRLL